MAPGESVRVRYVAATRMVSVVWRGWSYDMAALPAMADIAHMRFGVALWPAATRCASRARLRVRLVRNRAVLRGLAGLCCDVHA